MKFFRRDFIKTAGLATIGGLFPGLLSCDNYSTDRKKQSNIYDSLQTDPVTWDTIRDIFILNTEYIHMACLLLASHPLPVRQAIEKHRMGLNENPTLYVQEHFRSLPARVREAGAKYMQVKPEEIALSDSTTMGTALLINGLSIRKDQEMLTTDNDYYSTHRSIEFKAMRTGASFRKIPIYDDIHSVTIDIIVDKIIREIKPHTRLLTGTWVHSSTGLKLPVKRIAERLSEINANRDPEDRVLFFVDGVHGFGVENVAISDLGCDLFSAGTHKWIFAPRGTGVMWGKSVINNQVAPTIPTFSRTGDWGGDMTPGGFKAFEHQWAMEQAFKLHLDLGKEQVQNHIHSLAGHLKEGLKEIKHVVLYTPMDESLSSGIVCFDIKGLSPETVVARLKKKKIIATDTPYVTSYARLTPGIYNTKEEIEKVITVVEELG